MVKKFYADEFERVFRSMTDTWDTFPIADAVEEGDVPLEDQLVGYLLELMTMKASGTGSLLGDDKSTSNAGTSAPADPGTSTTEETSTAPASDDAKPDAAEDAPAEKDDARPSPPPKPEDTPKDTE